MDWEDTNDFIGAIFVLANTDGAATEVAPKIAVFFNQFLLEV
jgi:hypothetical protein